jgi:hypothetical protein
MESTKLFMLLLGCKPPERNTEQHDVFFGLGSDIKDLAPSILKFWPEAGPKIHLDAWREVSNVDGFAVRVVAHNDAPPDRNLRLFFINLGGYKRNEFEEYHYKMLVVAPDKGAAIQSSKQTAFYKHTGFPGATSHVDDKYGIDVDDVYEIADVLSTDLKQKYAIVISEMETRKEDELHLGYLKFEKLLT